MPDINKEPITPIPGDWITTKALKTVSGAALCCWMTTIFFDLIFFKALANTELATLLVLLVSTFSCLALALYRVFSTRGKKTKILWILVIPNAMLIYVHALGFQVASKELATRAYAEKQVTKVQVTTAGTDLFYFLTQQTSWIPDLKLSAKLEKVTSQNDLLQTENRKLQQSLLLLQQTKEARVPDNVPVKSSYDSSVYFHQQIRSLTLQQEHLKAKIATQDSLMIAMKADCGHSIQNNNNKTKAAAVLLRRIEDKNELIRKWNLMMAGQPMARAEVERQMIGYTGDLTFYKKLFQPMAVQVE
ncbi:hypothetical protein ACE38W_13040 [Chitinophaga sp. Hz27]|uniref:hypothetical protein n=1 Tax=Chitinophaga sp. Hz27 TaxID=3347169 RepID=UPI0035D7520D